MIRIVGIVVIAALACCSKRDEFLLNSNLIFQLERSDLQKVGVKIYESPSKKHKAIVTSPEFAISLEVLYKDIQNQSGDKKEFDFMEYSLLYVEIKDYESREYCIAKLHAARTGHVLRIFPNANSASYRSVNLGEQKSKEVKIVGNVIKESSKYLNRR